MSRAEGIRRRWAAAAMTPADVAWLLDVDGMEFESAVAEIRRERAAREKANGGRR